MRERDREQQQTIEFTLAFFAKEMKCDDELAVEIQQIHADSRGAYGACG
ncbi:hypothetical protein ACFT7S_17215 [Streptomyces sp. NPDC057136]